MDGRNARRKIAFAATTSVAVLALLGFAAFEFTGRVNHVAVSHMTASRSTASRPTASPAASETAKATASARTAASPASSRSSKARDKPTPARAPSTTSSMLASPSALAPVSAAAFGPNGTADGDNPQDASLVLTDPALGWTTQWYATPEFGALKAGTGLLLDMGRPVTITAVLVTLGGQPGADLELRGGPTPADLTALAGAADVGGSVDLSLSQPTHARYILLWFTQLPPDDAGTYRVTVHGVTVHGEP